MKSSNRKDYVLYRLERASESFSAALVLVEHEKWNSALNRLYYSCYYSVSALLFSEKIKVKTHSGAKTQFYLNFVKNNIFPLEMGKLYSQLFD